MASAKDNNIVYGFAQHTFGNEFMWIVRIYHSFGREIKRFALFITFFEHVTSADNFIENKYT